jgi:hypothetical protein
MTRYITGHGRIGAPDPALDAAHLARWWRIGTYRHHASIPRPGTGGAWSVRFGDHVWWIQRDPRREVAL